MTTIRSPRSDRLQSGLDRAGSALLRYSLVLILAWIGALKFTEFEARGIEPLVASSPFMSWVYDVFSVTTFSALLGALEIAAARSTSYK